MFSFRKSTIGTSWLLTLGEPKYNHYSEDTLCSVRISMDDTNIGYYFYGSIYSDVIVALKSFLQDYCGLFPAPYLLGRQDTNIERYSVDIIVRNIEIDNEKSFDGWKSSVSRVLSEFEDKFNKDLVMARREEKRLERCDEFLRNHLK